MRGIFRNIGWLLGSRGINAGLSLIYLALATRTLGVAGFGELAVIVVLGQAVAGVASFNTWQAVVRWGHAGRIEGGVAGFAVALDLASFGTGIAAAAVICSTGASWLPIAPGSQIVAFGFCAAALIAIRSTPTGLLRLNDRFDLAAMAEAVLPATRAAGAIAAALFMPNLRGFVMAWAAAEIACAAAHWLLARRFVRLRPGDITLRRLPRDEAGVWRFVFATSLSRTTTILSKQVLLLGVGALGGAVLAGGYRVASQLGQALVQLGEAVSRAVYPEFVRREGGAKAIAQKMVALSAVTGLVAAILAALLGKWAIMLVAGPEFAFAYPALVVLACAGAMDLSGASWEAMLVAQGRAGTALLARAMPLLLVLTAMPWAIAHHGLLGVACCVLVASASTLILLARQSASSAGERLADARTGD